jgi:hypothetical protein
MHFFLWGFFASSRFSVSKEGREGTYGALASAPLFLAKLPVGFMSGYLLHKYCPEPPEERHSSTMWLIIGLTTLSSPILMTIFWKYISYKDPDEGIQYTELLQQDFSRNNDGDTSNSHDDGDNEHDVEEMTRGVPDSFSSSSSSHHSRTSYQNTN